MSFVTRTLGQRIVRVQTRSLHSTRTSFSAHGDSNHLPFKIPATGETHRAVFGTKVALYLAFGASLPVIATVYQLNKAK